MKKIILIISLMPLLVSLSPRTYENNVAFDSLILEENTKIFRLIEKNTIKRICPSHILEEEAASVTFNYEVFEKRKDFAPYNGYKTSYHVLYRADIFLSNLVHYKGGVGNWFDGQHPAYIDYLKVSVSFKGGTAKTNDRKIFTPKVDASQYSMIKELNPTSLSFGSSLYNNVEVQSGFDANNVYSSNSYTKSWENIADFGEFERLNNRLIANASRSINEKDGNISVSHRYQYGYNLYFDNDANKIKLETDKNGKPVKKEFKSGPNEKESDFRFSIYGALNLQTDKVDEISLNVFLNTYHGSSVWLDKFFSSAKIDVNIIC